MSNEAVIVPTMSCLGLLVTGIASFAIIFDLELGKRVIKMGKSSWAPWTKQEGADWVLKGLTILTFLFFLGLTCLIFYGWLQSIIN